MLPELQTMKKVPRTVVVVEALVQASLIVSNASDDLEGWTSQGRQRPHPSLHAQHLHQLVAGKTTPSQPLKWKLGLLEIVGRWG